MVGEIRDQETAEIALRAAQTGHLVLSTLHTNTAIGAISRLQQLRLHNTNGKFIIAGGGTTFSPETLHLMPR